MPDPQAHAPPKPVVETLSSMIFGLALSVGAITLVGNVGSITTTQDLMGKISVFGFSFLILISVWIRYSKIMSLLPLENRLMILFYITLLFTVSLEPFLLNVLQLGYSGIKDVASQLYAVDLGVMMLIMGGFTFVLANEERDLIPKSSIREFKIQTFTFFLAGALFFLSTSEIFWTPGPYGLYWRFYLWIGPPVVSFIRKRTVTMWGGVRRALRKTS